MKEYIGIIGGNGYVGKNVVLALQKLENNKKILATTRKTAEGMKDQTLEYVHLDINNLEQLKLFCSNCSTIINCVGPSFIIGDKIAKPVYTREQIMSKFLEIQSYAPNLKLLMIYFKKKVLLAFIQRVSIQGW